MNKIYLIIVRIEHCNFKHNYIIIMLFNDGYFLNFFYDFSLLSATSGFVVPGGSWTNYVKAWTDFQEANTTYPLLNISYEDMKKVKYVKLNMKNIVLLGWFSRPYQCSVLKWTKTIYPRLWVVSCYIYFQNQRVFFPRHYSEALCRFVYIKFGQRCFTKPFSLV